jgi:excisionase family DNA binding protein
MDTFEKMMSVKEVAGCLGISRDSVVRLINGGYLVAVRFPRMGGRGHNVGTRVSESEVKSFISRNSTKR